MQRLTWTGAWDGFTTHKRKANEQAGEPWPLRFQSTIERVSAGIGQHRGLSPMGRYSWTAHMGGRWGRVASLQPHLPNFPRFENIWMSQEKKSFPFSVSGGCSWMMNSQDYNINHKRCRGLYRTMTINTLTIIIRSCKSFCNHPHGMWHQNQTRGRFLVTVANACRSLDKLPLIFHHLHVIACCKWDISYAHLRRASFDDAPASLKQGNFQLSDDHGDTRIGVNEAPQALHYQFEQVDHVTPLHRSFRWPLVPHFQDNPLTVDGRLMKECCHLCRVLATVRLKNRPCV